MKKIPKIIHYVWVGGQEKNDLAYECIKSWKKHCPEYKIIEWNETNFPVEESSQVKKALEEKNWAYASDIIRVWALKEYGGVYLDTDVLLIKNLDNIMNAELSLCYESKYWFGSAVIAAVKNHPAIELIWKRYDHNHQINFKTNPLTVHAYAASLRYLYAFKPNGKTKEFTHFKALSSDYFYPVNYMTLKEKITIDTIGIHYYKGSWHSAKQAKGFNFAKISRKILGKHIFSLFEKMVAYSFYRTLKKEFIKLQEDK